MKVRGDDLWTFFINFYNSSQAMISKEDFLNAEFLKQCKDSGEFASFMEELYVRGAEKMLEGELDAHLGYDKYAAEGRNTGNSCNGRPLKSSRASMER